jgi:arylsulfatase A-like enzyme
MKLKLSLLLFLNTLATTFLLAQKRPNVIIIYSDQHNAQTMGFMGHPDVITPNFDALAKSGVAFKRAYCPDAICVPSRNSLMSGLYPRTLGCLDNGNGGKAMDEAISMASVFKSKGYKTFAFGKRHTAKSIDKGWDVKKSHIASESPNANYVTWIAQQGYAKEFAKDWASEFGEGPKGGEFSSTKIAAADMGTRLSALPEDKTMEAYTTQETINIIKQQAKSGEPFFCWSTFYRPHQPYNPQPRFLKMYNTTAWGNGTKVGDAIKMPFSLREPADQLPPMLANLRKSKTGIWCLGKAAEDEQLYRDYIGGYYALVSEVDEQVGEILKALKENGLDENTIIVYTSDHGDFVGAHGMVEKAALGHNVYEETLQVPLIFSWKNHINANNNNTNNLVGTVDIFPTLLDLAGIQMPDTKWPLQGLSLAPTLLKNKPVKRNYIVSENWSQTTIITDKYKLGLMIDPTSLAKNRDFRAFGDMLFVRNDDPFELKNQINSPDYTDVTKLLKSYYKDFTRKISDSGKEELINKAAK